VGAEASRRWRQQHPDAVREQKRLYYIRSRERLREQRNAKNKARTDALREQVHELLGGVCCRCAFDDWRALQVDHINGGGRKDRDRFDNREQFLKSVLDNPSDYQLMCANCNWIKRHENREFGSGPPRRVSIKTGTED